MNNDLVKNLYSDINSILTHRNLYWRLIFLITGFSCFFSSILNWLDLIFTDDKQYNFKYIYDIFWNGLDT